MRKSQTAALLAYALAGLQGTKLEPNPNPPPAYKPSPKPADTQAKAEAKRLRKANARLKGEKS